MSVPLRGPTRLSLPKHHDPNRRKILEQIVKKLEDKFVNLQIESKSLMECVWPSTTTKDKVYEISMIAMALSMIPREIEKVEYLQKATCEKFRELLLEHEKKNSDLESDKNRMPGQKKTDVFAEWMRGRLLVSRDVEASTDGKETHIQPVVLEDFFSATEFFKKSKEKDEILDNFGIWAHSYYQQFLARAYHDGKYESGVTYQNNKKDWFERLAAYCIKSSTILDEYIGLENITENADAGWAITCACAAAGEAKDCESFDKVWEIGRSAFQKPIIVIKDNESDLHCKNSVQMNFLKYCLPITKIIPANDFAAWAYSLICLSMMQVKFLDDDEPFTEDNWRNSPGGIFGFDPLFNSDVSEDIFKKSSNEYDRILACLNLWAAEDIKESRLPKGKIVTISDEKFAQIMKILNVDGS